jgi:group I intron endonuclease
MSARIVCGIYRIRNTLNGRVYVGSAVNTSKRWMLHRIHLNRGDHHCPLLQRAWVKHGEPAFVFEIIEVVERTRDLESREQVYLDDAFATGLAYNICRTAGSILGVRRTEATREKLSLVNKGRRRSAEARARMSLAHKGVPLSPERCARQSAARKGIPTRIPSAETRAKMSLAKKGKRVLGRKHKPPSAEHRKNLSAAIKLFYANNPRKGKSPSIEHRANLSVALKRHHAARVPTVYCKKCGRPFRRSPSHISLNNFCSSACRKAYHSQKRLVTTCLHCGAVITKTPFQAASSSTQNFFCNLACSARYRRSAA